jgi:hypothetical protein
MIKTPFENGQKSNHDEPQIGENLPERRHFPEISGKSGKRDDDLPTAGEA